MAKSVLDAIREGNWEYEPKWKCETDFDSTDALPGSRAKLHILAERLRQGLPLWHPADRRDCEGALEDDLD